MTLHFTTVYSVVPQRKKLCNRNVNEYSLQYFLKHYFNKLELYDPKDDYERRKEVLVKTGETFEKYGAPDEICDLMNFSYLSDAEGIDKTKGLIWGICRRVDDKWMEVFSRGYIALAETGSGDFLAIDFKATGYPVGYLREAKFELIDTHLDTFLFRLADTILQPDFGNTHQLLGKHQHSPEKADIKNCVKMFEELGAIYDESQGRIWEEIRAIAPEMTYPESIRRLAWCSWRQHSDVEELQICSDNSSADQMKEFLRSHLFSIGQGLSTSVLVDFSNPALPVGHISPYEWEGEDSGVDPRPAFQVAALSLEIYLRCLIEKRYLPCDDYDSANFRVFVAELLSRSR